MKQILTLILSCFFMGLLFPAAAGAVDDLKLVNFEFQTHFNPGESVIFRVTVVNNEAVSKFIEVDITLTQISTGVELTLTPVLTGTAAPGEKLVLVGSYLTTDDTAPALATATDTIPKGLFTVAFPVFDGNGNKTDQLSGRYPLHVGTESESITVYPEMIHLGLIPPGRYMHPTPVEVNFDFFRFNRIRIDQPYTIRLYTDNAAAFHGVEHAIHRTSPGGLISADGQYVIPIKIWNLNYGPDIQETGWDSALAGPPPVDVDDYWLGPPLLGEVVGRALKEPDLLTLTDLSNGRNFGAASWARIPDLIDMTSDPITWRRLLGQDQFDSRFVSDSNITGDYSLASPTTFYLATDGTAATVEGSYSANLIVELWTP